MENLPDPETPAEPTAPERLTTRLAGASVEVFSFFKPTLLCTSWVPFIRAMLVLLVLTGAAALPLLLHAP
jgi:hypothetical protein